MVCSALLVLLGSPLRIYIISNGGYLLSCSLAFAGYFVYRQLRPDVPRPFRLPTVAKWVALAVFIIWMVIYFFGGWNSPKIVVGARTRGPGSTCSGLLIVALYAPLYWWRAWQDRRLAAAGGAPVQVSPRAVRPRCRRRRPAGARWRQTSVRRPGRPSAEPSGEPPVVR